jgi:enoyl-CoA hydratase/carnithine racemase
MTSTTTLNVSDSILVERVGDIAWITLNRPDSLNAIDDSIRIGMPKVLRELDADASVRVILVRGAGPRGFCAGADLKEQRAPETPAEARNRAARSAWFDVFDEVRKPTIAVVHGYCMGGGFEIALACDIRIASSDAVFALPETGLGLIPGGGGTQRLARLIGLGRALDLILTGERISAEEAQRIGAITRIAPSVAELENCALDLARRIAERPPLSSAFAKEAVKNGFELDLKTGLRLERDLFALLTTTEDKTEAANAFKEKRKPVFKGR